MRKHTDINTHLHTIHYTHIQKHYKITNKYAQTDTHTMNCTQTHKHTQRLPDIQIYIEYNFLCPVPEHAYIYTCITYIDTHTHARA